MRSKRWMAVGIVVAASAVLAACSSSGGSSSGQTTGSSAAPTTANSTNVSASGAIRIGAICSCTGAQEAAFKTGNAGIEAWAAATNATGGLNGHPIKLYTKDDGSDPTKALQAAKELVEQDKVIAIVGDNSLADQAFEKYVAGLKIPVVGGLPYSTAFATDPDFFASGAGVPVTTVGMMAAAKDLGAKKIGVLYCAESPVCALFDPIGKAAAKVAGVGYDSGKVANATPNFNAPCLSLKQSGVDALYIATASVTAARVISDCGKIGYKPLIVTQAASYGPDLLKSPAYEGAIVTGPSPTLTDTSLPATKEFLDALNKYEPGTTKDPTFDYIPEYGWIAGKLFAAASAAAGGFTPQTTSADVTAALYKLKNETLGGLSAPLTYTPGKPAFATCYFVSQIKSGALTSPKGTGPICLAAAQVQELATALGG